MPRGSVGKSVEVFNPHNKHVCRLPDLPEERRDHTHCGRPGLICGGGSQSSQRSCLKMDPLTGTWSSTPVRLEERRTSHHCWTIEGEGTLLMGGILPYTNKFGFNSYYGSRRSTELVSPEGLFSSAEFSLKYGIR